MSYLLRLLIALDQLANALIGGHPDETLSARAYRWHITGGPKWPLHLIEVLFFWDPEHCKTAYWAEQARSQLPPAYRP